MTGGADQDTGLVDEARRRALLAASRDWPSLTLNGPALADFELLATGAVGALRGYLDAATYERARATGMLPDGTPCPAPAVLQLPDDAEEPAPGVSLALRDPEGVLLGRVRVAEVYRIKDDSPRHVAGRLEPVALPTHYDFEGLRLSPAALTRQIASRGWRAAAFCYPHGILHRPHVAALQEAADRIGAGLVIHQPVGGADTTDSAHFARVRAQKAALADLPPDRVLHALTPLPLASPSPETLCRQAIVAHRSGATHLVVPSEAPGDVDGAVAAIGVEPVRLRPMVWLSAAQRFVAADGAPAGALAALPAAEITRRLVAGEGLPRWHSGPALTEELARIHPPRHAQGLTVFFTGLSGSGKSTIANILRVRLLERGRTVTLLDGDLVRHHLSSELGFSREHRDLNIHRIGFVAAQITRFGGTALCAPIAPYDAARKAVRVMIEGSGACVLVHVATPLEVCERRDRKGLYAKARAGLIPHFTGVSDPYEEPGDAEVVIDTRFVDPCGGADMVIDYLESTGLLSPGGQRDASAS